MCIVPRGDFDDCHWEMCNSFNFQEVTRLSLMEFQTLTSVNALEGKEEEELLRLHAGLGITMPP